MIGRFLSLLGLRKRACTCSQWERTYPCLKRYGKYDCRDVMANWKAQQSVAAHDGDKLRAWMDAQGYDE